MVVKHLRNALCLAVMSNNILEVQCLLAGGADVNLSAKHVRSALAKAVIGNQIDMVRALLEYGANPNQSSPFSERPPLELALCFDCNFELIKMLLDHGANTSDDTTNIAIEKGNLDVLRLLLDKGADPKAAIRVALSFSPPDARINIVKALLEAGADVNAIDLFGETALHMTTCPDIVVCLLDNGAQINAQDKDGYTPLFSSVCCLPEVYQNKKVICTEPLLFAGANVDIPDRYGQTFIRLYDDKNNVYREIDVIMEKFRLLNIKGELTRRFNVTNRKTEELTAELDRIKKTNVEGICLFDVFEQSLDDFVFFNDSTFRTIIQGDEFKEMFPHFYLLIRLYFREAERKYFLRVLSETFSYKMSEVLQLNIPTDVGYLITRYLIDRRDINKLKLALQ